MQYYREATKINDAYAPAHYNIGVMYLFYHFPSNFLLYLTVHFHGKFSIFFL